MIFKKDFISIKELSSEDILFILNTAETMKLVLTQKNKKVPHLQGRSVILLFYEKSSRTKLSYDLAAQYLSASVVDMTMSTETKTVTKLTEVGQIIDQMGGDFIVLRHPMSGSAKLLAENVSAGVINAGDGFNENPSQSLLDLMTIKMQKGSFEGLKVAIIGDISHSRVSRSNIFALLKLKTELTLSGPPSLVPDEWEGFGPRIVYDIREAVKDADVIMVTRLQQENAYKGLLPSFYEYRDFFKIDEEILRLAKPDAIVMHPGPINRGVEISSGVIDSKQCLVEDQIANGVAIRMALLYLMSMRGGINV